MYSLLILFLVTAIVLSFLCSMLESVLLSITPSYAQLQEQQGSKLGRYLKSFKANIDRPLAAILTLNTIAHTVGAIGVGDQASIIWRETNPIITAFVVPVLMTLAILILSEIIPKTIGANYWKEFAPFTIRTLVLLEWLLAPLIWVSEKITRSLRKGKEGSVLSRSEFLLLAEIGAREGAILRQESELIKNLLRFNSILARDIMTPRVVVQATPQDLTVAEFLDKYSGFKFSRIPVYEGDDAEKIVGYVRKDELLETMLNNGATTRLADIKRNVLVILDNHSVPDLLNQFLSKREHIALVVDEFGGMEGIVTMEDVPETLLGLEIVDELDTVENMQNLARRQWERRAKQLGLIEEE